MTIALIASGLLIGLILGSLGAGGSILAVPVLVHVAGLSAAAATVTSLVAVGSAAATAAIGHRRRLRLDLAAWFVPTGFVGALVGAAVSDHFTDRTLLLGFSALMLVAAARVVRRDPATPRTLSAAVHTASAPAIGGRGRARGRATEVAAVAAVGAAVGFLTGLFGVGGGFVIVPALALAVGLAMPEAVATSLVIIAVNAAIALTIKGPANVDWPVAVALTVPMLGGSIVGARLARRLDPDRARRSFAALLVIVAVANAGAALAG